MNMHNTVQTWSPFKAFKEEPGKIQMNGSRQAHLCFKGCLWLPEKEHGNVDLTQLYVLVHLPALPIPLQKGTWSSGRQRSRRRVHTLVLCACKLCISPAHPLARKTGVKAKEEHKCSLGAASGSSFFMDLYKLWQLNILWQGIPELQSPTDLCCIGSIQRKTDIFTFLLNL